MEEIVQNPEEEDSEKVQGRQCLLCVLSSWGPVRQPTGSALRDHSVACNVLLRWMQKARTNAQMKICKSSLSLELRWVLVLFDTQECCLLPLFRVSLRQFWISYPHAN